MTTPLLENILAQPSALQAIADYQLGPGLAAIQHCADLLRKSKQIVLTGMGASLFACAPVRYALAARGIAVSIIETAELLYFLDELLGPDTLLILVSRSGESVETVKLLDRLEGRHCATIGVVNVAGSTLAVRTTEHILLNSPADQLVAVQSYAASVVTLLLLAAIYAGELESARSDLHATIQQLGQWITENISASESWRAFIDIPSPIYLLSRGPGFASVDEGVLLMHEVAKMPATGMSVAQFRHGFVEAAGKDIRVIVIGTQSATSTIDHQFAIDLGRMGAAVRWIGPLIAASPLKTFGNWPKEVPLRFTSIFEAIPLQLFAYRTAESRGIVPGSFRWASTVTASESGFPGLSNQSAE